MFPSYLLGMVVGGWFGFVVGGWFGFVISGSFVISKQDRINATLETIAELQSIFSCVSDGVSMLEKLDDVRVVVEGMKRQSDDHD
jgi:hypothetical protein